MMPVAHLLVMVPDILTFDYIKFGIFVVISTYSCFM